MNRYNIRPIFRILPLAGSFLLINSAFAQQGNRGETGASGRQGSTPSVESIFVGQLKKNDKDGSGTMSFEETSAERFFPQSLFDAIDTDGDGDISMKEAVFADKIDQFQGPKKRITFEGKEWVADYALKAKVTNYKGKEALNIIGREQTYVFLPIDEFQDGTIEVDIASDAFCGIGFRGRDNGQRVERLYFRPMFTANADRRDMTVQYAVTGRKDGHWLELRKSAPGKYNAEADIEPGEWFHAKFVIKGTSLKVYINGSEEPQMVVDPLLDGVSQGSVGVWGWDSHFANFKYVPAR